MHLRVSIALLLIVATALIAPAAAFAYQEPNTIPGADPAGCGNCHPGPGHPSAHVSAGADCDSCHRSSTPADGYTFNEWTGPHMGFSSLTRKCEACHAVHDAVSDEKLLPAATVVGTCFTCHDGTAGWGVYGTVKARTGLDPGAGHRSEATSLVPGGDGATGGSLVATFNGPGGNLICTDCHSPHGANVVAAFKGDRRRVRGAAPGPTTTRLLKQKPTGATSAVTQYGSDWCLACHRGRSSGGVVHNHPVDSLAVTTTPFTYSNVSILASHDATKNTELGPLGGVPFQKSPLGACSGCHTAPQGQHWDDGTTWSGNRGYLMPYPRTAQQGVHYPICQQCHEDSRYVGSLDATGDTGDAATATIEVADSVAWNSGTSTWTTTTVDGPRFQDFPHETQNERLLVETNDDLCLNCHPAAALP